VQTNPSRRAALLGALAAAVVPPALNPFLPPAYAARITWSPNPPSQAMMPGDVHYYGGAAGGGKMFSTPAGRSLYEAFRQSTRDYATFGASQWGPID
jgi:hypothetical protein